MKRIAAQKALVFLSVALSVVASVVLTHSLASFTFSHKKPVISKIPGVLAQAIIESKAIVAQHGLTHRADHSEEELKQGLELLINKGLKPEYFINPYGGSYPHPSLPTEYILKIKNRLVWDHAMVGTDNFGQLVAVVHIQDPITEISLKNLGINDIQVLRLDDVNTDIISVQKQVKRINILREFCEKNNISLLLSIIPHVERLPWWYKLFRSISFWLCLVGLLLIIPTYVFYIVTRMFM